jgi:hypothetical protein
MGTDSYIATANTPPTSSSSEIGLNRFYEIEFEKLFDGIVSWQTLRMQMGTFFGTVNLAALSIAFTTQRSGLVIFAAVLLWLFCIIDMSTVNSLNRLYVRSTQLQDRFAPGEDNTFLTVIPSNRRRRQVRLVLNTPPGDKRDRMISHMGLRMPNIVGFWLPLVASLIEIGAALTLSAVFQWSVF